MNKQTIKILTILTLSTLALSARADVRLLRGSGSVQPSTGLDEASGGVKPSAEIRGSNDVPPSSGPKPQPSSKYPCGDGSVSCKFAKTCQVCYNSYNIEGSCQKSSNGEATCLYDLPGGRNKCIFCKKGYALTDTQEATCKTFTIQNCALETYVRGSLKCLRCWGVSHPKMENLATVSPTSRPRVPATVEPVSTPRPAS